jgi:hypothetical protein
MSRCLGEAHTSRCVCSIEVVVDAMSPGEWRDLLLNAATRNPWGAREDGQERESICIVCI